MAWQTGVYPSAGLMLLIVVLGFKMGSSYMPRARAEVKRLAIGNPGTFVGPCTGILDGCNCLVHVPAPAAASFRSASALVRVFAVSSLALIRERSICYSLSRITYYANTAHQMMMVVGQIAGLKLAVPIAADCPSCLRVVLVGCCGVSASSVGF